MFHINLLIVSFFAVLRYTKTYKSDIKGLKREFFPFISLSRPPSRPAECFRNRVLKKRYMCHCAVMKLRCMDESERQFDFIHTILLCGVIIQLVDVKQLPLLPLCVGEISVFR